VARVPWQGFSPVTWKLHALRTYALTVVDKDLKITMSIDTSAQGLKMTVLFHTSAQDLNVAVFIDTYAKVVDRHVTLYPLHLSNKDIKHTNFTVASTTW
jgi:hypothetical protein